MAVRPAKEPWPGARTVIRRFGISSAVLFGHAHESAPAHTERNADAHDEETHHGQVEDLFVVALRLVRVGRREEARGRRYRDLSRAGRGRRGGVAFRIRRVLRRWGVRMWGPSFLDTDELMGISAEEKRENAPSPMR